MGGGGGTQGRGRVSRGCSPSSARAPASEERSSVPPPRLSRACLRSRGGLRVVHLWRDKWTAIVDHFQGGGYSSGGERIGLERVDAQQRRPRHPRGAARYVLLSVYLPLSLSFSACLSICLSTYLSVWLAGSLSFWLPVWAGGGSVSRLRVICMLQRGRTAPPTELSPVLLLNP